jgi:gluconate 2-dehydrogenase gamma chain
MRKTGASRRSFLAGSASAWVAASWPGILAAQKHSQQMARSGAPGKLEFFSAEQAAEVEAVTAQIIPSDETPGAREARTVHFIDRALATFEHDKQPAYTEGLQDLQAKSREISGGSGKFSSLTSAQQIQVLTAIEKTPFFTLVRMHTIVGFFANPEYGGNESQIGWKLMGFEDHFNYKPPFGYYDANYKKV